MFVHKRIFVVGVPRSGTTLVQSVLSAHPEVYGYPETHFFRSLIPSNPICRILGLTSRRCWAYLGDLESVFPEAGQFVEKSLFRRRQVGKFIESLDRCASDAGCGCWAEKTPAHLHSVPFIELSVNSSFFIHVLRHPYEVVASMYEAANAFPEVWGSRTIETCCMRWNRDVELSLGYADRVNHLLVRYDLLNTSAELFALRLFEFLGLDPRRINWGAIGSSAGRLIKPREKWKAHNSAGLSGYMSDKFDRVLTEDQRSITRDLIDLKLWDSIQQASVS